jgi:hypothetical protein
MHSSGCRPDDKPSEQIGLGNKGSTWVRWINREERYEAQRGKVEMGWLTGIKKVPEYISLINLLRIITESSCGISSPAVNSAVAFMTTALTSN